MKGHFDYLLLFSRLIVSDSLWPHELQRAMLPCPSLALGICSNSCPLSQWCHPTISSSVVPFSSCPQSFPASGSFPMNWLFASGGQSIGALALAPSNEYSVLVSTRIDWFDIFAVQGTLKSLLQHHNSKPSILQHFQWSNSHILHDYWKTHSLDCINLCQQSDVSAF